MYKYLTPQEIEEFEKTFSPIYLTTEVEGFKASSDRLLSFIDTLIGKRVGESFELKIKSEGRFEPLKEDFLSEIERELLEP